MEPDSLTPYIMQLVRILSQILPAHYRPIFKSHYIIIPSTLKLSKCYLHSGFRIKDLYTFLA